MKIILNEDVSKKIKYYVKHAPGEVSGLGKIFKNDDGDIVVTDVCLFEQECSGSVTKIDDKSMDTFMREMVLKGESIKDWMLWWHSHADLGVFWSPTDDKTIEDHSESSNYLASLVVNKKGESKGRLDIFPKDISSFGKQFKGVQYDIDVEIAISDEEKARVESELDEIKANREYADAYIKELEDKEKLVRESILKDDVVDELCKKEVEEKVRERVYKQSGRVYDYDAGDQQEINFDNFKKKHDLTRQKEFESVLKDIAWGVPRNLVKEMEGEKEMEKGTDINLLIEQIDEEEDLMYSKGLYCPECQNPIEFCMCDDAFEKWHDKFTEKYIMNQFMNIYFLSLV